MIGAKVKIEKLKKKDLESFYLFAQDFILKEYQDYPPQIRRFYWHHFFSREKLESYLKDKDTLLLVAKNGKEIIGFLRGFVGYGGSSWINWLGVERRFRKRGIGVTLLQEAEDFLKSRLCHFIQCCAENLELVNFYQKRGWKLIGLQKKSWCGQDEYLLQKNIAKPHFELWQ